MTKLQFYFTIAKEYFDLIRDQSLYKTKTKKGHFCGCNDLPCHCEIKGYWYLFWIATVSSSLVFLIAEFLANSAAAQAYSLYSFTQGLWYLLAIKVDKIISKNDFTIDQELQVRAKYGMGNATLLLITLGWVTLEAIQKLLVSTPVVSNFMILSVSIGFIGNTLATDKKEFETYKCDTFAGFGISVIMLTAALTLWILPYVAFLAQYTKEIQLLDPILSLAVIIWISRLGYKLFITKTMVNL